MLFIIDCSDKPDHSQVRLDNRAAHLAYLEGFKEQLVMAGPLLGGDDDMIGSLLIMDFANEGEVEAFCDGDPYAQAGLFDSVAIRPWRKTLPA